MIKIISKKEGFRRCGVAHSETPKEYPDDRFAAEEIAVMEADPMLIVVEVPGRDTTDDPGKKKGGK